MKITIITVSYNAVDKIEPTICSVLAQSYPDVEYMIFDGGSHDGTVDVIRKYEDRLAFWKSEPDDGLYHALNKGVLKATGDWIGILNCGDVFSSKTVLSDMFAQPIPEDVGVIYGNCMETNQDQRVFIEAESHDNSSDLPPDYRHGASFVRADVHQQYLFDIKHCHKYGYALDYLQIFTMFRASVKFQKQNITVIDYEKEGISDHQLRNKYYRALIVNGGNRNLGFFTFFVTSIIRGFYHKVVNYVDRH